MERAAEDDDGTVRIDEHVFKVALDEEKADRLRAEERALKLVGGGAVVQLRGEGLREIGGRTVLVLEYAGEQSLGARLRGKGKLTYHELERFGEDLFQALDQLAANGVRHRDIKPDNFGIHRRRDRTWQLKLFDFSLTDASGRETVLRADGASAPGRVKPGLATFVRAAWQRVAEAPRGLWLLCPVETRVQIPHLDGRTVEVISGDGEQAPLDGEFLGALAAL